MWEGIEGMLTSECSIREKLTKHVSAAIGDPGFERMHFTCAHETEVHEAMTQVRFKVKQVAEVSLDLEFSTTPVQLNDPVGMSARAMDSIVATWSNGVSTMILVFEEKTRTSFSPSTPKDLRSYHANVLAGEMMFSGVGGAPGGFVRCGLTQLGMFLHVTGLKYGVLTTYTYTWLVCMTSKLVAGTRQYGMKATSVYSVLSDDEAHDGAVPRSEKPGRLSRAQVLLLLLAIAEDDPTLPAEERREMDAVMLERKVAHGERFLQQEAKDAKRAKKKEGRRPPRRSQRLQGLSELPLEDFASVTLDHSPEKLVRILGGEGLGFKDQMVYGHPSFVKVVNSNVAEEDAVEELRREARMYGRLAALCGRSIPYLVFAGDVEGNKFAVITTTEGDSLESEAGQVRARKLQSGAVHAAAHTALQQIHDAGVLHGDVACRNIVVSAEGNIKFIDLGRCEDVGTADKGAFWKGAQAARRRSRKNWPFRWVPTSIVSRGAVRCGADAREGVSAEDVPTCDLVVAKRVVPTRSLRLRTRRYSSSSFRTRRRRGVVVGWSQRAAGGQGKRGGAPAKKNITRLDSTRLSSSVAITRCSPAVGSVHTGESRAQAQAQAQANTQPKDQIQGQSAGAKADGDRCECECRCW